MEALTVTLKHEPMALMNPSRPQPDQAPVDEPRTSRSAPMKFLYATGDRPLEGYTIRRGIGRGGFGEVYFAESDAGKEVAMKLIRRNLDVELRGVRHCLNLKHPNLVALYDIRADEGGDEWVIMEYVAGGPGLSGPGANSLEDVLDSHPNGMPAAEALRWMHGIAAGVAHLHDNGIVHRDLKPGNIFLDGDTVKIGDYGLSKFISCSRRSGQTESVGTVHYMAPEIANGRYGREIDTYALGVILYEMLTGHVPFEGESVGEVLMKHLTAEPDLARIEEPYREIVRRALAKDPELRVRSVAEMVEMLPGDAAGAGVAAGANTGRPPGGAPVDRAPVDGAPALDPNAPISVDARRVRKGLAEDDEPIYRSLIDGWTHFWRGWRDSPLNPAVKAVLLVLAGLVLMASGVAWLPVVISMGVLYCVYYVIWAAFIRPGIRTHSVNFEPHRLATTAAAPRQNRHARAAEARRRRLNWREAARSQLAAKTWRTRLTELTGSMLVAAALCSCAAPLATALIAPGSDWSQTTPLVVWLAIVSTLGAWAVLATSKFTEGVAEDQAPMRSLSRVLGAGVGLAAALLSTGMPIGLPQAHELGPDWNDAVSYELFGFPGDTAPASVGGRPAVGVAASVAYFACLFLALRWWRQAEYTREKRLSLLSVIGCVFFAWLLHIFWWYPQPTGMAVAAIVAVTTQLASPWLPPSKREALARQGVVS
ncbi:MAG: serine/threonine-protein kinase [Planctomycetota bacterium]